MNDNDNPCYALVIKGHYPFDDRESYLQVQFWCETEEFCYPERWLAVPKSRASRFTREAINQRLTNQPEFMVFTGLTGVKDVCFQLSPNHFEELELELEPEYVPEWDSGQLRLAI